MRGRSFVVRPDIALDLRRYIGLVGTRLGALGVRQRAALVESGVHLDSALEDTPRVVALPVLRRVRPYDGDRSKDRDQRAVHVGDSARANACVNPNSLQSPQAA